MSDTNDKMHELNQRRKEHGEKEIEFLRSNFWKRKQIEERKQFDRQSATEALLDLQYQSDHIMVMELIKKWLGNVKNESQKETLFEVIKSLMRMSSYVNTLQTVAKSSVCQMLDEKHNHNKTLRAKYDLEKENKALKTEIQYYIDEQ